MNKRQKLVQEAFLNNEEAVIRRLKQVYNKSLMDMRKKVQELQNQINELDAQMETIDNEAELARLKSMKQSKVYQKQYQDAMKKQVGSILDNMQVEEFKTVSEYLNKCYEEGFLGTMYDLQGQGIPLCFPMDQEAMVRAVQLDSKISNGLYSRLGEDVDLLKKKITAQVGRGISTGMTFAQVAKQLESYTNIGFNNAVRIARTEGHRIQVQSAMDACYKAREKGADVVKQWDSTLDGVTRPSHQQVDGEIRELDKKFSNGLMFPGDPSGGAAEVVNCRCALLQRARWALEGEFSKYDNFSGELKTFENDEAYQEFKKEYFSKENVQYMKYVEQMQTKYKTKDYEKILGKMTDQEYKHFTKLQNARPIFEGMYQGQGVSKIGATDYDGFKKEYTKAAKDIEKRKEIDIIKSKFGFKEIDGNHSIFDDIGTTKIPTCNPNFKKGRNYQMNCGNCSVAYEMRRRGFDVEANPKNGMYLVDWLILFEDFDVKVPKSRTTKALLNELNEEITKWGEGARGSIFVQWKGRKIGHYFSFEVKEGKVLFVDAQNGKIDASEYFRFVKPSSVRYGRWDGLDPSEDIKDACKNKGD